MKSYRVRCPRLRKSFFQRVTSILCLLQDCRVIHLWSNTMICANHNYTLLGLPFIETHIYCTLVIRLAEDNHGIYVRWVQGRSMMYLPVFKIRSETCRTDLNFAKIYIWSRGKACRTDPNFASQSPRSGTYFEDWFTSLQLISLVIVVGKSMTHMIVYRKAIVENLLYCDSKCQTSHDCRECYDFMICGCYL